jgi:hypothetical protein
MIGYRISKTRLEELIEKEAPGWLKKAASKTEELRTKGYYDEKKSIWSAVKAVYMRLQGAGKCAYCERKLESVPRGKPEQDIEHFQPKGRVRNWELPKALKKHQIMSTAVPNEDRGYYLLPFHPFNYAASCKPCNSVLKRDFFPIAGKYLLTGDDPISLMKEKPFLIYPVGDFDDAPENLIRFHGVSPQPVAAHGHNRERALVTIEFFELDDQAKRKNLVRERAFVIVALHPYLEKLTDGVTGDSKAKAQDLVDGFTSPRASHTNCAKSYKELFEKDRAEATAVFDRASLLIDSIS